MAKYLVLGGAGAMGQITVYDLAHTAEDAEIIVADINLLKAQEVVNSIKKGNLNARKVDLNDSENLEEAIGEADCVINASPYYFNRQVMNAALKVKTHYLDLGGLYHETLKQLPMHDDFEKAGILAILGMGSTPGTTNVMAEAGSRKLDTINEIAIYCAGADNTNRNHPFLPPYMLDTILDEYTMDAIIFQDGKIDSVKPISFEKEVEFQAPIGKQITFPTIHSELATLPERYKNKGIKNLSFNLALDSDFHNKLKFLVELGFGSSDKFVARDAEFYPRQVLAQMIAAIEVEKGPADDIEVLRVDLTGSKDGKPCLIRLEAVAAADKKNNIAGGDFNTGYPPSIVAQMIVNQKVTRNKGVLAPEECIDAELYFKELGKRNIVVSEKQLDVREKVSTGR